MDTLNSLLDIDIANIDNNTLSDLSEKFCKLQLDPSLNQNEMLHLMQLMQLAIQQKNDLLVETKNIVEMQDEELHVQDLELKRLRLIKSDNVDLVELQEELIDLENRYEFAMRDIESVTEMLDQERQINSNLMLASKEDYVKLTILTNTNKKLEQDLRDFRINSSQKTRFTTKSNNGDDDGHRAISNQKNQEINKFIQEVDNLSTLNDTLTSDLENVTNELQAAMEEIDNQNKEIKELNNELEVSGFKIMDLIDERDKLLTRVGEFDQHFSKDRNRNEILVSGMENNLEYFENKCQLLEKNKIELESKLQKMESQFGKVAYNNEIESIQLELLKKDKEIKRLKAKLNAMTKDFELLALDWDKMDKESKTPKREELVKKVKSLNTTEKEKLDQKIEYLQNLHDKDLKMLEMGIRLEKFENGEYGLKNAINEVKTWKAKYQLAEKHINEHIKTISDLDQKSGALVDENIVLRSKLGQPLSQVDISNFKNSKLVELEQIKILVGTLQNEIEKLEDERIELKTKLRFNSLHSKVDTESAELNLGVKDILSIEEYCKRLKSGHLNAQQRNIINKFENIDQRFKDLKICLLKLKVVSPTGIRRLRNLMITSWLL